MGTFLSYSITSGLLMLAMYLAYRVFLARENQHGYNRMVLLLIYVISFTLLPILPSVQNATLPESHPVIAMAEIEAVHMDTVAAPSSSPVWGTALIWVFVAGLFVTTVKTAITWIRLIGVIRSGERIKKDGYTLVITESDRFAAFSWLGYIVISREDYQAHYSAIVTHELKHVESHHWVDLLLAQIVCIINWFNPAAWLMRDELMLVHEYQADMAVIDSGHNPQQYQRLLIKKAVGARFPSLANSLNHSKLKKRITMMYQEKSGAGRKLKALALVPMLALALGVVAVPAVRAAVTTINNSEVSTGKVSEKITTDKTDVQLFKVKNVNNKDGKTTITIQGEDLGDHISISGGTFTTNGKTYEATELQYQMVNGKTVIEAIFPFVEQFDKSSMTLIVNGEEVSFDLESLFNKVPDAVVQPQYPGGEAAIMQAVMEKLAMPDTDFKWKDGAYGVTLVKFTVMPDGTMSNFERALSCGYGDLDQFAIDAVKNGLTEKWIPGTFDGKPVAVTYAIPIRFKAN